MELNANFAQRVLVHSADLEWSDSPIPGVRRRMLDRIGDEVARATSVVSYEPGSSFSPHIHTGGEEFIVLEGVFQDEHGDFPVGSYIRNPPQSSHTPGSEAGCVIFVKLWQFDMNDRYHMRVGMDKMGAVEDASRPGVKVSTLYQDDREVVRMEQWSPGARVTVDAEGGAEIFVLEGGFTEGDDDLVKYSWLRVPVGDNLRAHVGPEGAKIWLKSGHLRFVEPRLLL
jgi:anti-sigma factor ChrR (cupin superfamily)